VWNVKCFVVTAVTGATGLVTKELRQKVSGNNTRQAFNRLLAKKKSYTETSRVKRKVLQTVSSNHWLKGIIGSGKKSEIRRAIIIIIIIIITIMIIIIIIITIMPKKEYC
jgi:type IV secretory pathway component VirB8